MYSQKNPYLTTLAASSAAHPAPSKRDEPEKKKDGVLSRVPKRATIDKPPVKLSMAPRYRFALPDPPTDLLLLRGPLLQPDAAARVASRLELDAKRVATPLHPSFGMRADLVSPAPARAAAPRAHLTPEDHVLLDTVDAAGGGGGGLAAAADGAPTPRRAMPPPKRSKAPAAFPWMRRMSYDEYFSGTGTDRRSSVPARVNKAREQARIARAREQRRRDRADSFRKVRLTNFKHPDKSKAHLKVVSTAPVFRNPEDVFRELVSMQFDRMGPTEGVQRFAADPARGKAAFQSAVTISVDDDESKKFMACFVPDDKTLREVDERGGDAPRDDVEMHELLREFSVRDAAQLQQAAGMQARKKRTFVMTTAGEGKNAVVGLSDLSAAFLLTPRQNFVPRQDQMPSNVARAGGQGSSSHTHLELACNPLTDIVQKAHTSTVVDQVCEKL